MKHNVLGQADGMRRFAVVFDMDDDVLEQLQAFCRAERVVTASISGIGGFRRASVAYYDMEAKRYEPIAIDEQVEVVSLLGNVTQYREEAKIHLHCIVGHRDGRTTGGHLLSGIVRPTLELFVHEYSERLQRTDRPEIGIPLIAL